MDDIARKHRDFCSNYRRIPPDSLGPVQCHCGTNEIMELKMGTAKIRGLRYSYGLACPGCGKTTNLDFRIRVWPSFKRRISTPWAAVTTAVALAAIIVAAAESPRMRVFNVLLSEGPGPAIEWLKNPVTAEDIFGKAWAHYTKGEKDIALDMTGKLLQRKRISQKTLADTFYLKGLLFGAERLEGLDAFSQAIEMYEAQGALNSQFLAIVGFAESVIAIGDLEYGQQLLSKAERIEANNPNLGDFILTSAMLNFWFTEYELSIQQAHSALDFFDGTDVNARARALSVLGLSQIAAGEKKAGMDNTIKADEVIIRAGLEGLWYYNQINYFLLQKLSCLPGDSFSEMFARRLEEKPDTRLKRYVTLVESYRCAKAQTAGDGTSSPPPPD